MLPFVSKPAPQKRGAGFYLKKNSILLKVYIIIAYLSAVVGHIDVKLLLKSNAWFT